MTQEQTSTIKFNVGGKLYEVSKSLLKRFPDTLLAQKASDESETPIFIDRDPDRFAYCLDYMRDGGKLHLPEVITKSSILQELGYFGFGDIDESLINDETSKLTSTRLNDVVLRAHQKVAKMQQEYAKLGVKLRLEKIALICLQKSVESCENEVTAKSSPWSYQGKKVESWVPCHLDGIKYFRECCSKLGMEVLDTQPGLVRFRKLSSSNPTEERSDDEDEGYTTETSS